MNEQDRKRLEEIEKLLAQGHSSDPLLNDLGSLKPQADPRFKQRLEDRLLEKLDQKRTMQKMQSNGHLRPISQQKVLNMNEESSGGFRFPKLPLTLVATLAIFIGIGGLLFWAMNQQDGNSSGASQGQESATPVPSHTMTPSATPFASPSFTPSLTFTPAPADGQSFGMTATPIPVGTAVQPENMFATTDAMQIVPTIVPPDGTMGIGCLPGYASVVVTKRDLPRGTYLESDMLTVTCWVTTEMPIGSFAGVTDVVRFFLNTDLRAWSPILADNLMTGNELSLPIGEPSTAQVDDPSLSQLLEPNEVAITFPLETGIFHPFRVNDQVAITLSFLMLEDVSLCSTEDAVEISAECQAAITNANSENQGISQQKQVVEGRIVRTGWVTLSSDQRGLGIVTLAVSEQDALVLVWALDAQIPMSIDLKSPPQ